MGDPLSGPPEQSRIVYNVMEIMQILPHRYPFLLVDRVLEMEAPNRIVGLKNVTMNEEFFQGHFPGAPVMPGVLILEAMAQVGAILLYADLQPEEKKTKIVYFSGIEDAKFRRPVMPGDQMRIEVEITHRRPNYGKMMSRALVEGKLAAEAVEMFVIRDRPGLRSS